MSADNPNPTIVPRPSAERSGSAAGAWKSALALLLILALAAAVRCYHLSGKSLWLDEYFSLECSAGWARTDLRLPHDATPAPDLISLKNAKPWWTIWNSVAADENHPPVFFILLRGWRALAGDSPAALRSFSVLASLLSIVLLFCIAATTAGRTAAIGAALLMALTWPQIQRAQDARPYALLTTVALAAALALVRIERLGPGRWRYASLAAAALVLPFVHYQGMCAIAAMALYAILILRGRVRRDVLICLFGAVVLFGVLWGPHLLAQRQTMIDRTAWLSDDPTSHLTDTWARLALVPVRFFMEPDQKSGPIAGMGALALLAPLLAVRKRPQILLWWLWIIVPVLVALIVDLRYARASLGNTKYTTLAEPAAYLLLGMAGASIRRWGALLPATLALACILCLPDVYRTTIEERDWRPLAEMLRTSLAPGEPILLIDHSPGWPAGYFLVGLSYQLPDRQRPLLLLDESQSLSKLGELQTRTPGRLHRLAIIGNGDDMARLKLPPGARLVQGELFSNLAVAGIVQFGLPATQP